MSISAAFPVTSATLAAAGAGVACTTPKRGKQITSGLAVGLMMVKKSKKRNPT